MTLPPQDEHTLRPWINAHNLVKIQGKWWKDNCKVITTEPTQQRQIISQYHDPPTMGHPGISRTMHLIRQHLWWPKSANEVEQYVKGCADCQWNKANTQGQKAPLSSIFPQPNASPFSTISMDFIVKLPKSQGYDSILTITDQGCMKMALFLPCHESIDAEGVAQLYFTHIFPRFGVPSKIITDQDPRFTSQFMKELCKQLRIKQNTSTAYHPRTDGQSERTNQWLEQYLRFWVNHHQDNWRQLLPMAEYAHNSWRNETTKTTPYQTLMGYNPAADWRPVNATVPAPITQLEQWTKARQVAYVQMKSAQECWAKAKKEGRRFQKGDLVWLEGRNLKVDQPTSKLAAKRYGPFSVVQVLLPITYQLTLPVQWKIHLVFHVDLLTPYKETAFHGANYTRPPPDLIDNEEEYEIEQILNSRTRGRNRRVQYLVGWVGYPESDNQWLDADQLTADEAIREFKKKCPDAITHIRHATMGNPLIDFPLMSSPTPSTIENVIHSNASSPHGYSLAAPLTATQQVVKRFPDPTQPPDSDDSLTAPKPITSGLDPDEPVVVRTVTPSELQPYTVDLADYSPMRTSDSEVHLSCAPSGPHCAKLDQPRCAVCHSFCKEPGGPTNRCFCRQEAEAKARPKYDPSGDETVHNLGAVYPHPGGTTPGPCISRVFWEEKGLEEDDEDSSDEDDYDHEYPFLVPTMGTSTAMNPGVDRGWATTHMQQGPQNGRANSPIPPGFVLNIHPNYIPFKLVDNKTGQQIPAKYVQLFLNNNDPYTYGKMSATGPTFITKIQVAPDTDAWEKPDYKAKDTQYFDAKYHNRAEVDAAVGCLCDPSLQAEVRRYRAA